MVTLTPWSLLDVGQTVGPALSLPVISPREFTEWIGMRCDLQYRSWADDDDKKKFSFFFFLVVVVIRYK
jgi:hypothetical protein